MDNSDLKNYEVNQNVVLRQYQTTLIELAKKQNTIIYLPTGCGKTMIALHVLLSRSHEIARPFNNGGKRAFFLATTKLLVYQIASTLKIHTKFKVGCYTGDLNVDSWDLVKWQNEIKSNEVLVATAEILRQILVLKFISPSNISLIIFDECHHASQNHPYKQIMEFINDRKYSSTPLIMGLSATLFKTNPKVSEVESLLKTLEKTYNAKIVGGKDWNDVLKFVNVTKEKIISFNVVDTPSLCVKYASDIYEEAVGFLNELFIKTKGLEIPEEDGKDFKNRNGAIQIKRILDNANKLLNELGAYGGSLAALYYTVIVEKQRLQSINDVEIQALIFARTTFNKIRRLLSISMEEEESCNIIYKFSSPKVQKIIDLILQINKKNDNPSTLIFVHKRATAIILAYMMKRLGELGTDFKKIKTEFVIGSSIFSKEFYTPLKSNEEILKRFFSKELNVLFCTNVLEEGIDIPSCNVVISFDFPLNYSSYIQSKGRARDSKSYYYVFCQKDKELNALQLWNEILNTVKQKVGLMDIHEQDEFSENSTVEENIYILTKTGNTKKIDGITAIKCVNRYCTCLKQDLFSCLSPVTWYKENEGIKTGFLQLPIGCPLRQIISGKGKPNLKLTKKSVYLRTVQLLHEKGLIDDNLCFVDQEKTNLAYLFPHWQEETAEDSLSKAGIKKKRRAFLKKFASCLSGLPSSGKIINFHVINFNPVFTEPYIDQKLVLYDLIKEPCTYGILSTKKFPKICQFPLFLDLGQLNCNILVNYDTLILSDKNIADIKLFHYALFEKVLHTVKNCQVFDNSNKDNSFFIVPVQLNEFQRFELNWDIICSDFCKRTSPAVVPYNPNLNQVPGEYYQYSENYDSVAGNQDVSKSLMVRNASRIEIPEMEEKKNPNFIMNEEEYLNFIISPIYRCISPPQYYYVVQCCHNLSPRSSFPREEFKNFYDYYWKKYGKKITNLDQPLLKVTHVPNCSNFNNPLSKCRKKKRIKDYIEYFVPELCDIVRYPPRYWVKAQFLPAVIDRISRIFLVEELRKTIARETGLGVVDLPADSFWKPLVEEVDDSETEEGNNYNFNEKLPLSELKNNTDNNTTYTVMNLERNLFDISACDLENYMKMFKSKEEKFDDFESLERNKVINELKELQEIAAPTLNILNLGKTLRGPELAEIVRACTAIQANDLVNYERLEILGDSFLKFASSFFLFKKYREAEGFLSSTKSILSSNKNLMQCALKKNLNNYINTYDFSPHSDWNPPLLSVPERLKNRVVSFKKDPSVLHRFNIPEEERFSGFLSTETLIKNLEIIDKSETADIDIQANELINRQVISDKVLADVVEAITGAYICNSGLEGGLIILKWFDVVPKDESSFKELFEEPFHFEYLESGSEINTEKMLEEKLTSNLEDMLGYSFKNKAFLLEALTHPSFILNRMTLSFQRLEFLGDAILDFLITVYIYENFGSFGPGKITDVRSAIVNNITFGCLSIKYDFYKFMFSMSPTLNKHIESCVKFQISRNHAVRENVLLVQEEGNCLVAETVSFPKALGDIFESIAGAIFLDSGNSLKTVWNIYYKLLKNVIDDFTKKVPKSSTRLLYEILDYKPEFTVTTFDENLIQVEATFEYKDCKIDIQGFGKNKKDAILSACKLGLEKILKI